MNFGYGSDYFTLQVTGMATETHRLYGDCVSGNCYKVALIMHLSGVTFEWVPTSVMKRETRSDEFLTINPNGKVPALVLPDGRTLSESNAMLIYFAEGTQWLPEDAYQRALVNQWLFFEQYSHEPNIAVARFMVHIAKIAEKHPERMKGLWKGGNKALALMETHLAKADFLVGGSFTIADIALYAYTHTAEDGGFDLQPYPHVRSWLDRVTRQEGFVTMAEACQ